MKHRVARKDRAAELLRLGRWMILCLLLAGGALSAPRILHAQGWLSPWGWMDDWTWAATLYNDGVFVGGRAATAGEVVSQTIAATDFASELAPEDAATEVHGDGAPGMYEWQGSKAASPNAAPWSRGVMSVATGPTEGSTKVSFDLPSAARVRVAVYSPSGRQVRSVLTESMSAGSHEATWDGCDASGAPVPAGVYYIQIESPGFIAECKTSVLR